MPRIGPIYEGTNGIQAIDLVTRKLPLGGGAVVEAFLGELRGIVEAVNATNDPALGWSGVRLEEAVESLARATHWLLAKLDKEPTRRSPAQPRISACSAWPPAAACWRSRRSPRCGSTPMPAPALPWRDSLPRISPSRLEHSSAPWSKARRR